MDTSVYLTFVADFPDDGEWDSDGNAISPPGKGIADFLAQAIKERLGPVAGVTMYSF